jgi:predicted site-specific integrase-resolvase
MTTDEELLTPVQARKRAGVSHRTFQRYRAAGRITPAKVLPNGHARFRADDVDAMLASLARSVDEVTA